MHKSETVSQYEWFCIVKNGCPACMLLKEKLREVDVKYVEVSSLDPMYFGSFRKYFANDMTTVPIIFHRGTLLGGYSDIKGKKIGGVSF